MWALLLARIDAVLPLLCSKCGGEMKIIAFITEGAVIREILGHLDEPTSPPRLMPARGPPLWEMPGSDPNEGDPQAQPEPDYEFRPAHRVVEGQDEPRSSGATRASGHPNGERPPPIWPLA